MLQNKFQKNHYRHNLENLLFVVSQMKKNNNKKNTDFEELFDKVKTVEGAVNNCY